MLAVSPVRFDLYLVERRKMSGKHDLPVRRDSLSPAISPLKYDFDAICNARALVRSGFDPEIAAKEPFDE